MITESDLPGVGHKYTLEMETGGRLSVIIHHQGKREIFYFEPDNGDPSVALELSDLEARRVGAILGGAYFKPQIVEDLELAIKGLLIEWFKLDDRSKAVGKNIAELQIRKQTGVSVIAIQRGEESIVNPPPETTLLAGDTVIAIGLRENFEKFKDMVREV